MGWQDDEMLRRRKDIIEASAMNKAEQEAFLSFWNKLLEANNRVIPEIRAKYSSDGGVQTLTGSNEYTGCIIYRKYKKYHRIDAGEFTSECESIYFRNGALVLPCKGSKSIGEKEAEIMIRNICTGKKFFTGI